MRAYGTANTNDFAARLAKKTGMDISTQKIYDMSFRILNGKRVRVLGQRIGGRIVFNMSESGVNQPDLRNARVLLAHPHAKTITTPYGLYKSGKISFYEYNELRLSLYDAKLATKFRHMYIQLANGKGGYSRYVFLTDIEKIKSTLKDDVSYDPKTNTVRAKQTGKAKRMTVIRTRKSK